MAPSNGERPWAECGCQPRISVNSGASYIAWCPLHAAAPSMEAWLRAFVSTLDFHEAEVKWSFPDTGRALKADILHSLRDARALLATLRPADAVHAERAPDDVTSDAP